MVEKLLSGKHLIGRGSQKIQKLQLLGRHIHGLALIEHGIIGLVDDQIRVFHDLGGRRRGFRRLHRLIPSEHGLNPGHQLLGIKGLDDVVVRAQLKAENLIKDFALGGQHDDRRVGLGADLSADLIAVDARQHQIQQNQLGLEGIEDLQGLLAVIYNHGLIAFFGQIQRNQLCNIIIVVDDENFLFRYHSSTPV